MKAKPWTPADIRRLYNYSQAVSQKVAARRLGRTQKAVSKKARHLGIKWLQGTWSYSSIALVAGCSPNTVRRLAEILHPDGVPMIRSGKAPRVIIPYETGQRMVEILQNTRKHREQKIRAGKARHAARI